MILQLAIFLILRPHLQESHDQELLFNRTVAALTMRWQEILSLSLSERGGFLNPCTPDTTSPPHES